jgi:saccharopine dehydrogenase (NAD+, L-lysine-forming)
VSCPRSSLPLSRLSHNSQTSSVGAKLVPNSSWPTAPLSTPIIGLKELPESKDALPHTHIMFGHCYKNQGGWSDMLARFYSGPEPGTLYDLEFLQDSTGRRVAAFGFHAGFAGAAVGALALSSQLEKDGGRLGQLEPYPNEQAMVEHVRERVKLAEKKLGRGVRALVIGALGRCGRGAVDLFQKAGLAE